MKYFFLVCHKPLGSSLQKCVEFSIGKSIEEIINIEITPNDNLARNTKPYRKSLAQMWKAARNFCLFRFKRSHAVQWSI